MKLKIYIQPNAKKNEVVGYHGDSLKIKIKAPPADGEANDSLIRFLSEKLGVAQKNIDLAHGHASRNKLIQINSEMTEAQLLALLLKQD